MRGGQQMNHGIVRSLTAGVFLLMLAGTSQATVLFDNGPVDVTNITWNMTTYPGSASDYVVVDEFVLTSTSTIDAIVFDAWHIATPDYLSTKYAIYDSLPAGGTDSNTPISSTPLVTDTVVDSYVSNELNIR